MTQTDAARLTADLIRCQTVTPVEGGALTLLEQVLTKAGFTCTRADRGEVCNLFARWGQKGHARTFGFNGHTDVVPVGDQAAWTMPPFGAQEKDGFMYGRGATDMKSGVAAFAAAAIDLVRDTPPRRRHHSDNHRRRRGRRRGWHHRAAGAYGGPRRGDVGLSGGRTNLSRQDGRDDQDRAARVDDRVF